jgi:hypothetical protein
MLGAITTSLNSMLEAHIILFKKNSKIWTKSEMMN